MNDRDFESSRTETRERVVAIAPSRDHLRPDDGEIERRAAVDRRFARRVAAIAVGAWLVAAYAGRAWWVHDDGLRDARGTGVEVRVAWFFAGAWFAHVLRLMELRRRCEPGSRRAHVLSARLGALVAVGLLGLGLASSGSATVPLVLALYVAYTTWLEATRHRLPARIVLGPLWRFHRWDADREPHD